jgi:DNA-binding MarR family transcriptional regulator
MEDHREPESGLASAAPAAAEIIAASAELRARAGQLMRRLRAASEGSEVTMSQASVLSRLDRCGPATTSALAKAEGVRPQSMGATLLALEEAGMVARTPHPTDRRQALMLLTRKGRHHLEEVRRSREGWLVEALEQRLDDRERAVMIEAIGLLGRLVDE